MKAIIQRVNYATLSVEGKIVSQINKGLLILLGVKDTDTEKEVKYFADKLSKLRVFEDENGKMNLSANQVGAKYMLVSNFTLYGDAKGSNRPSFILAARPEKAEPLYNMCANLLNEKVPTVTGIFGAEMFIDMQADGPVTIVMDSEN